MRTLTDGGKIVIMKKRYSYLIARQLTVTTGIVFISQLILEMSGLITRKPGLEWVIYACGGAFFVSVIYSAILIVLNIRCNN